MNGAAWIVVPLAALGAGYGALNLIAPSVTMRWQRASASRARPGSAKKAVGTAFGEWASSTKSVRIIGACEVIVSAVCIVIVLTVSS